MPTITITTTNAQAQMFAAAVGAELELGRDATAAECKAFVIALMRNVVQTRERLARIDAARLETPTAFEPS